MELQGNKLEYLENQSRNNNIRVSGIPESADETWETPEAKVKDAIKESTMDIQSADDSGKVEKCYTYGCSS